MAMVGVAKYLVLKSRPLAVMAARRGEDGITPRGARCLLLWLRHRKRSAFEGSDRSPGRPLSRHQGARE